MQAGKDVNVRFGFITLMTVSSCYIKGHPMSLEELAAEVLEAGSDT